MTFETIKKRIEVEQGRPLSSEETLTCKAIYYFALGVELRNEMSLWRRLRKRLKSWLRGASKNRHFQDICGS